MKEYETDFCTAQISKTTNNVDIQATSNKLVVQYGDSILEIIPSNTCRTGLIDQDDPINSHKTQKFTLYANHAQFFSKSRATTVTVTLTRQDCSFKSIH